MSKKIGFAPSAKGEKDQEEDPFIKAHKARIALISQFIDANYSPTGGTEQKNFRTSAELEYLLQETISVSLSNINEVMKELKFELIFLEGVPNWIVYEKGYTEYMDIDLLE